MATEHIFPALRVIVRVDVYSDRYATLRNFLLLADDGQVPFTNRNGENYRMVQENGVLRLEAADNTADPAVITAYNNAING